jgi:hypothetical protein
MQTIQKLNVPQDIVNVNIGEALFTIASLPDEAQDAKIQIKKGQRENTLEIIQEGTIFEINGRISFFCAKTVEIGAELRVPLGVFAAAVPSQQGGLMKAGIQNASFDFEVLPEDHMFVVTGAHGATLRKEGKQFFLQEGEVSVQGIDGTLSEDVMQDALSPHKATLKTGDLVFKVQETQ